MIKGFESFINEEAASDILLKNQIRQFKNTLENCQEYYSDIYNEEKDPKYRSFSISYNNAAHLQKNNPNPESDLQLVIEYMYNYGISTSMAENLVRNCTNNNIDFLNDTGISGIPICAPIDYYLYKLTNKKHELAGYKLTNFSEKEEHIIKYSYGCHKTSYGKLYLNQSYPNSNEFFERCAYYFPNYFMDNYLYVFDKKVDYDKLKNSFVAQANAVYVDIGIFQSSLNKKYSVDEISKILDNICDNNGMKHKLIGSDKNGYDYVIEFTSNV